MTALALAIALILQAAAPAPDCSEWSLDGIRVGMTRDELEQALPGAQLLAGRAVPGEPGERLSLLWRDEPSRPGAVLVLQEGRVQAVRVLRRPTGSDEAAARAEGERQRADLVARLGEPSSDERSALPAADGGAEPAGEARTLTTLTWSSDACGVVVVLQDGWLVGRRGGPQLTVTTTLSSAEWQAAKESAGER